MEKKIVITLSEPSKLVGDFGKTYLEVKITGMNNFDAITCLIGVANSELQKMQAQQIETIKKMNGNGDPTTGIA